MKLDPIEDDPFLDWFEAAAERHHLIEIEHAKTRLAKLKVAELRILYRHYFKCEPENPRRKLDMIDDLAPEVAEDGR